jgi:hypothetical protein
VLDLQILCCTALYALGVPFRFSSWAFGVPQAAPADWSPRDEAAPAQRPATRPRKVA